MSFRTLPDSERPPTPAAPSTAGVESGRAAFPLPPNRVLLSEPENKSTPRLFVAATRQNEGKTTTCLSLFSALQSKYSKVGYIKPIGQRFIEYGGLKIDEDSYLVDSIFNVDLPMEAMSPVAIDGTFTRRYLLDPEGHLPTLVDKICRSFDRAAYEREFCIVEGSGHAGVGAVFDLSNAQVARILKAKAILVSSGGIGRPVDEIALNKALFDKHGVQVVGAIINKVQPDRMEMIREYTRRGLERLGVPLLGVLPEVRELSAPSLGQIVEETGGRWLNGRVHGLHERIYKVVIGAMAARALVEYFEPGVLIITPGDREDVILAAIAASGLSGKKVVSGIILTRNVLPHPRLMEMLARTTLPVVICSEESYAVASCINGMTVKTQPQDTDKIPLIRRLVQEHVDLDRLRAAFAKAV